MSVPLFRVGDCVSTIYGDCQIDKIRVADDPSLVFYVCVPLTWKLDRGIRPTFYMNAKDVKEFEYKVC